MRVRSEVVTMQEANREVRTDERYKVVCEDCGLYPLVTSDRTTARRRQFRHEITTGHYAEVVVLRVAHA